MTKTILLADDSVTIQKVVELTFLDEDFRVTAVGNGAEAIARLGETTPDVVIADVHMPGADGYEVCRRSKELHPSVPVLLLAGTFEAFDAEEATRCGADGHLKKPFDSQELLRRVRDLAQSTVVAQPRPREAEVSEPEPWVPETAAPAADEEMAAFALEPTTAFHVPEAAESYESVAAIGFAEAPRVELAASPTATTAAGNGGLSDADVERVARRVIELAGERVLRDVAWEVVPDLAEVILKARIRELEASVE